MNQNVSGVPGNLAVRVSTAGGVIPVEDAVVYVRSLGAPEGDRLLLSLRTDGSGRTRTVALPASFVPDGPQDGQTGTLLYGVEIKKDGFRTIEYSNVPVYEGVTSIIEAELEPVTEEDAEAGRSPKAEIVSPPVRPDLFGDGGR